MRKRRLRQFIGGLALLSRHLLGGETQVTFDYSNKTERVRADYASTLAVGMKNVNTLDYRYEVRIESILPRPSLPPGGHSASGPPMTTATDSAAMMSTVVCNTAWERSAWEATTAAVDDGYRERLVRFGEDGLSRWRDMTADAVRATWAEAREKNCVDAARKLDELAKSIEGVDARAGGEMPLAKDLVAGELGRTSAGGAIRITVKAVPYEPQSSAGGDRKPLKPGLVKADLQKVVDDHGVERVFTIEFNPPGGVVVSFGPYVSSVSRREFERISDKEDPTKAVIATSEDSSVSYGVGVFWNATICRRCRVGATWGVAYNVQNQPEEAIAGLLGAFWTPGWHDVPVLVNAGVAIGREKTLTGGWAVGETINRDAEIPTGRKTVIRFFAGMTFTFGGRR